MIAFITFVLVFGLLVFAHELGHFLAARKFGVSVEEFALGLPPKILAKKRGETRYVLNLIPIGGYVRLHGEDGTKDNEAGNLVNKTPLQRALIFTAGVIMNILLAYVLLTGFYLIGGQSIIVGMDSHPGVLNSQKVVITDVEKNSPAEKTGIKSGDTIVSVNGKEIFYSAVVSGEIQAAKDSKKPVEMLLQRGDKSATYQLETYTDKVIVDGKEIEAERIGVVMENVGQIRAKWYLAPIVAGEELVRLMGTSLQGIADFAKTLVTRFRISENVGGPVAIYQLTGTAAQIGFGAVVQITIMLSIVLAVFNILPFPALDGGHLLFIIIEKVRGKEIDQGTKNLVSMVGFGLLLVLVAVITWGDLGRFGVIENIKRIF